MNEDLKLKILHIFFPNKCACCKRIIKYDRLFCEKCENDFEKPQGKRCKTCFSLEEKCDCKRFPKFFFRSVSPFLYKNSAKAALLSLKRIKNKRLARFFAEEMYLTVIKKYKDVKFDAVIPVPLYKSREKARGYNQSLLLANELATMLKVPVSDKVLIRVKEAKPQHSLTHKQRRENVKGIYKAGGIPIECQRVLLVDDIMTSGSTLNECAKMLRLEGVTKIYCVTSAKA